MNVEIAAILTGLVTIALWFVFFYYPWQTFVVDQTRQRLFEIRDRWFDYSLKLTDPADKRAAACIRDELNFLIRLAHHLTIPVIITGRITRLTLGTLSTENPLASAIRGFKSANVAKEAQRTVSLAFQQITWCIVRRSALALAVLPIAALLALFMFATSNGAKSVMAYLERWTESAARQAHQNEKFA